MKLLMVALKRTSIKSVVNILDSLCTTYAMTFYHIVTHSEQFQYILEPRFAILKAFLASQCHIILI